MAKKKQKYHSFYEDGIRFMECSVCGTFEENISQSTTLIVCSDCLAKQALNLWNPMEDARIGPKKAKGWHWMKEFVDSDGNVYHKGKEAPELKGTLPLTKIKKTIKKIKSTISYEQKINLLAKEYKKKQKLKKKAQSGINK